MCRQIIRKDKMESKTAAKLKLLITIVVIALIALAGFLIYRSLQFRMIKTVPAMGAVPTSAPYIRLYFNQSVEAGSVKLTSNSQDFGNYKVDGKTITLPVAAPQLQAGQTYTIELQSVTSTKGKTLASQTYSFVPKVIAFEDLSSEVQQAILQAQANRPKTRDNYAYTGLDALLDQGVSSQQLNDFKQAIFQYLEKSKKLSVNNIGVSSVTTEITQPGSTASFNLSLDNSEVLYAKLKFQFLTEAQLYLYTKEGQQVYDSGVIDLTGNS